jgi:hypothetical protein
MRLVATDILTTDMYLCSGSQAELGPRAGQITWNNCLALAYSALSSAGDVDYDAIQEHIREYGAWDAQEIADMTKVDLLAFIIQEAAADLRKLGVDTCDELADATVDTFADNDQEFSSLNWSTDDAGRLVFGVGW